MASALLDILNVPGVQQALMASPAPSTPEEALAGRPLQSLARTLASVAIATCTRRGTGGVLDDLLLDLSVALAESAASPTLPTELSKGRLEMELFDGQGLRDSRRRGITWELLNDPDPHRRLDALVRGKGFRFLRESNDRAHYQALALALGTADAFGTRWSYRGGGDRLQALVRAGVSLSAWRSASQQHTLLCSLVERFFSPGGRLAAKELMDAGASLESGNGRDRSMGVLAVVCCRDANVWPVRASITSVIDWLLHVGAHLEARDASGLTPLMHAAMHDASATAALLAAGADPSARDKQGRTALHHLCDTCEIGGRKARAQALRWLLRAGADMEAADAEGDTPLMLAVKTPQPSVVRQLLEAGADACARTRFGVCTPLLWTAALHGHESRKLEYVQWLVDHGADVSVRCCGRTLLHALAEQREHWLGQRIGQFFVAQVPAPLLDARDHAGRTPLMRACLASVWVGCQCCGHETRGNILAVRCLAQGGADVNLRDPSGRSAWALCAGAGPAAAMRRAIKTLQ